ncbi:hypothetical protein VXS05_00090 [Photobacterium toruni]|jgi:hypothetical protein|uniref:hypothetical protein n=1 Tax=Photobacterium toruni TaxID=1935446 RepID=UPI002E189648|nr:hypothetical protein [Photobacterium toruni]
MVELSAYDIALIGGCFTIAGALITVISGHWLAKELANYTYKHQQKDHIRNEILFLYQPIYPLIIEWPKDINSFLVERTPTLGRLIESCRGLLSDNDFKQLLSCRDELLEDIDGYIKIQCEPSELFYGEASIFNSQNRFRERLINILSCIK